MRGQGAEKLQCKKTEEDLSRGLHGLKALLRRWERNVEPEQNRIARCESRKMKIWGEKLGEHRRQMHKGGILAK